MVRFKAALAISALGLMTLTACGEQVKEVGDAAGDVTDKAGEVAGDVKDKAGEATGAAADTIEGAKDKVAETAGDAKDAVAGLAGIPAFQENANDTLEAVKSGDFETAKAEVSELQEAWGAIADQVKEKAPDVHTNIEEGIGNVTSGLESETPDQEQLVASITTMIDSIKTVSL